MEARRVVRPGGRARRGVCRRACLTAALVAVALLVFAAEAQAYVSGDLIYAKRVGTSASPAGSYAVAAGPDGVTVIAGEKWSTTLGDWVPMVAKYSVSGERKWLRTYPDLGPADLGPQGGTEVAVDPNGGVFVATTVNRGATGLDIVLLRYGSAGTFKWARVYDGPASDVDFVAALLIDKAGNIIVVGGSKPNADQWGIVALKYSKAGDMLWAHPARFDPDPADPDASGVWPYDAARDADGNIYVAGESEYWNGDEWISSALMVRFDASDGNRAWGQVYESVANPQSYFSQVAVRGTLVVGVGSTWPDPEDALVVRYNTSGVQRYAREWGAGNGTGEWYGDVVMDGSYNIYVTGGQWSDYVEKAVTMKLRSDLTTVWKATYLPSSDWAETWYLARNSLGNIYVAGARWTTKGLMDILTIKYGSTGARKWVRVWSAGGPDDDVAWGLVLGTAGGVYVTGEVTNKDDFPQAALLKYKL